MQKVRNWSKFGRGQVGIPGGWWIEASAVRVRLAGALDQGKPPGLALKAEFFGPLENKITSALGARYMRMYMHPQHTFNAVSPWSNAKTNRSVYSDKWRPVWR
jgi:hypothetical protein